MPKGGKKGKKKSKAQLKQEEEERKAQEAEALRLQEEERVRQEELERLRLEEEERQRQLREKRKAEEAARLQKQGAADGATGEVRQKALAQLGVDKHESREWQKALKCDPLPDAGDEPELNSFITMWSDPEMMAKQDPDALKAADDVVKSCGRASRIATGVLKMLGAASEEGDKAMMRWRREQYARIGALTREKQDAITVGVLSHSTYLTVADRELTNFDESQEEACHGDSHFGIWANDMVDAFKPKRVEFKEHGVASVEIPKNVAIQAPGALALRALRWRHDFISGDSSADLCAFGGVYQIEILQMPPPARKASGWVMQSVDNRTENVCVYEYGLEKEPEDPENAQTVAVKLRLPHDIFLGDDFPNSEMTKLGWWEPSEGRWRTDGITSMKWAAERRELAFTTCHLRPMSLVYQRGIDWRITAFQLSPAGVDKCRLTLAGQRLEVVLEVVGGRLQLVAPDIPALQDLLGQPMQPGELLIMLQQAGIHLNPVDADLEWLQQSPHPEAKVVGRKPHALEMRCNREIATIAASFEVTSSHWNHECPDATVLFRVRKPPAPEEEPKGEAGWLVTQVTAEKCTFIKSIENDTELILETPDDELAHRTLARVVAPHCTDDMSRELKDASLEFQEAVRRTLNLTRVLQLC